MADQSTVTARAKQALGKTGDFWALVEMAGNIDKCKSVLAEIRDASQDLAGQLAELRKLQADVDLREQALAKLNADASAALVKGEAALVERGKKLEAAEAKCADREAAIGKDTAALLQRENALAAREAKVERDEEKARSEIVERLKSVADREQLLALAEASHAETVAAFEAKFAKARAILSAVPDDDHADAQAAAG